MVKKLKMQNFIYTVLFSVLQYQYNGDKDFFSFFCGKLFMTNECFAAHPF